MARTRRWSVAAGVAGLVALRYHHGTLDVRLQDCTLCVCLPLCLTACAGSVIISLSIMCVLVYSLPGLIVPTLFVLPAAAGCCATCRLRTDLISTSHGITSRPNSWARGTETPVNCKLTHMYTRCMSMMLHHDDVVFLRETEDRTLHLFSADARLCCCCCSTKYVTNVLSLGGSCV